MNKNFTLEEIENIVKEFSDSFGSKTVADKATVVGFSGNLGAGKTTFTKELLRQLGFEGNVASPTFVLRRDYEVSLSSNGIGLTPNPSPLERGIMQRIKTSVIKNYDSLKLKAKEMRSKPTEAEKKLWEYLRGNYFDIRFRRQHIINNFIVDFVNLENKIIIEVDGNIHDTQKEKDEERSKILENLGYRVLRFKNEEVINNIELVLKRVKENIAPFSPGEGSGMRRTRVIHIDAYRLEKPEQIYQVLSKEELADKNNFIIIEWPEKVFDNENNIGENIFDKIFYFEHVDENTRKICL